MELEAFDVDGEQEVARLSGQAQVDGTPRNRGPEKRPDGWL